MMFDNMKIISFLLFVPAVRCALANDRADTVELHSNTVHIDGVGDHAGIWYLLPNGTSEQDKAYNCLQYMV